jgi:hypothetical protein
MTIDYKTHKLTFGKHLPAEPSDLELPLRLYRLATVRGVVTGGHAVSFVVDTGGEVISISHADRERDWHERSAADSAEGVGHSGWERTRS